MFYVQSFMSVFENFWADIQSPQADEKLNFEEIEEIITKYNATNSITCNQRSGDVESDCNLILATVGCFIFIMITSLIFILIRWYFLYSTEQIRYWHFIRKTKNREVLVESQTKRNQRDEERGLHQSLWKSKLSKNKTNKLFMLHNFEFYREFFVECH